MPVQSYPRGDINVGEISNVNDSGPLAVSRRRVHDSNYVLNELKTIAIAGDTPFLSRRTAEQAVQFAVDPSEGLTRKRYGYFSNGTLFDTTNLSEVEAGIRLETTATGTDTARLRSAVSGQYVSQSEAQPGVGVVIDESNVSIDTNGRASVSHGEVYLGSFDWDQDNNQVNTGLGFKFDSTGIEFFIKSLGDDIGPSPVPQAEWNVDPFDGTGPSEFTLDPADGYVYNFPYTWYNQGPLSAGLLNPDSNRLEIATIEKISARPSIDTPNHPTQVVVRNDGTAQTLGVEIGGMQFTTYGADLDDVPRRQTDETRITTNNYISDTRGLTNNAVDPSSEPGKPLISFRRDPSEAETLNLRSNELEAKVTGGDIYVFIWDEYDEATALTGESFGSTVSLNNAGQESHLQTDTSATDYAPETAVVRGIQFFPGGGGSNSQRGGENVDLRIPMQGTRIYTAVNDGSNADVEPFVVGIEEGY